MKRVRLFLTLLVITLSFTASAQYYSHPYDANACAKVKNRKSACNQGAEPFYKFIAKFQSNASFRNQRLGEYVEAESAPQSFKVYRTKVVYISGSKYKEFATWSGVSKNSVTYVEGFYEGSNASTYYTFERINGKWYLTGIDYDA